MVVFETQTWQLGYKIFNSWDCRCTFNQQEFFRYWALSLQVHSECKQGMMLWDPIQSVVQTNKIFGNYDYQFEQNWPNVGWFHLVKFKNLLPLPTEYFELWKTVKCSFWICILFSDMTQSKWLIWNIMGKWIIPPKQVIFSPNDTIRLSMLRARTCCYICCNIFICFEYISISRSLRRCHMLSASTEVYQSSCSLADLSVIDSCSARAPGFHCRLDEHFDYIDQSKSMISCGRPWAAQKRHHFITANQSAGLSCTNTQASPYKHAASTPPSAAACPILM